MIVNFELGQLQLFDGVDDGFLRLFDFISVSTISYIDTF